MNRDNDRDYRDYSNREMNNRDYNREYNNKGNNTDYRDNMGNRETKLGIESRELRGYAATGDRAPIGLHLYSAAG